MNSHRENFTYSSNQENHSVDMTDLASYTYNCPSCGGSVTTTAPRELLDKTEIECVNCRLTKDGTMAKIKEQMEQEDHSL